MVPPSSIHAIYGPSRIKSVKFYNIIENASLVGGCGLARPSHAADIGHAQSRQYSPLNFVFFDLTPELGSL